MIGTKHREVLCKSIIGGMCQGTTEARGSASTWKTTPTTSSTCGGWREPGRDQLTLCRTTSSWTPATSRSAPVLSPSRLPHPVSQRLFGRDLCCFTSRRKWSVLCRPRIVAALSGGAARHWWSVCRLLPGASCCDNGLRLGGTTFWFTPLL